MCHQASMQRDDNDDASISAEDIPLPVLSLRRSDSVTVFPRSASARSLYDSLHGSDLSDEASNLEITVKKTRGQNKMKRRSSLPTYYIDKTEVSSVKGKAIATEDIVPVKGAQSKPCAPPRKRVLKLGENASTDKLLPRCSSSLSPSFETEATESCSTMDSSSSCPKMLTRWGETVAPKDSKPRRCRSSSPSRSKTPSESGKGSEMPTRRNKAQVVSRRVGKKTTLTNREEAAYTSRTQGEGYFGLSKQECNIECLYPKQEIRRNAESLQFLSEPCTHSKQCDRHQQDLLLDAREICTKSEHRPTQSGKKKNHQRTDVSDQTRHRQEKEKKSKDKKKGILRRVPKAFAKLIPV